MDNSELENRRCPACCRVFGTSQGMVAHLSSARTCTVVVLNSHDAESTGVAGKSLLCLASNIVLLTNI